MKQKGIITYYLGTKKTDKVIDYLIDKGIVECLVGYYPVIDNKTNKETSRICQIVGPRFIVRILDKLTEYHGKDAKEVDVEF